MTFGIPYLMVYCPICKGIMREYKRMCSGCYEWFRVPLGQRYAHAIADSSSTSTLCGRYSRWCYDNGRQASDGDRLCKMCEYELKHIRS